MRPIIFSRKLMQTFGDVVSNAYSDSLYRRFKQTIMYMIDWRTRRIVNIQRWMKSQLDYQIKNKTKIYEVGKTWGKKPDDEIVMCAARFVRRKFEYKTDFNQFGSVEVWEDIIDAWENEKADCETQAMMIFVLCRIAGVSEKKIKIRTGDLFNQYLNKVEGHCYLWYLADYDGVPRIIDTTAYYDNRDIKYRPYIYQLVNYRKVWWTCDDKQSFGRFRE